MFLALAFAIVAGPPRLHIDGKSFVDDVGHVVPLRGVNLGGWLVEETWMTPVQENPPKDSKLGPAKDHVSLWGAVETRLGHEAMVRVRNAWRENWITEQDFDRIKAMGLNHVRLPFLYRLFEEPGGVEWIRRAVRWAKARNMYVVLDLHGAPGGQSAEHHTGERDKNKFWSDSKNIPRAERLWGILAREYANEPTVVAYDLMNEPMGVPNPATLAAVYSRLINAVRKYDANKPVIVDDAYRGFDTTPHPDAAGWTQVAFSLHRYNFDAKKTEDHLNGLRKDLPRMLELQGYRNSPIYVGEFNLEPHGGTGPMVEYAHAMDAAGLNWAIWTFKTCNPNGPMGAWGLVSNPGGTSPIDPFVDDEKSMTAKLRAVRSDRLKAVDPGLRF